LQDPDRLAGDTEPGRAASVPLLRLVTLTAGVFCLAGAGPVQNTLLRAILIAAAVALVGLTFRLDRGARSNLFPPRALSLGAPIGLALWILSLHGMTQTSVSLFLPLLLQVVHGVSPVFINIVTSSFHWAGRSARSRCRAGPAGASALPSCPARRSLSRAWFG